MLIYESNTLQHHGVKGMKWGVRKERKSTRTYVSNAKAHKNHEDAERKARMESLAKDKAASKSGQRITAYQAGKNMRKAAQQAKRDSIEADREQNRQLRDYDRETYGRSYSQSWLQRNGKQIAAGVIGAAGALIVANILSKKAFGNTPYNALKLRRKS
jgi:hypothetical protein